MVTSKPNNWNNETIVEQFQKARLCKTLCFWQAIANGYALSALVGSDNCRSGSEKVFATGSFWFSAAAQAAALTTLKVK